MAFQSLMNLFFNQLTGFFLWLLVTPLRLVVALLDPIFGGLWDFLDPTSFLSQIEVLKGFFTDVNWFLPFGACVGIVRLVLQVMFLVTCAKAAEVTFIGEFAALSKQVFHMVLDRAVNGIFKILDFFFPSGIFSL